MFKSKSNSEFKPFKFNLKTGFVPHTACAEGLGKYIYCYNCLILLLINIVKIILWLIYESNFIIISFRFGLVRFYGISIIVGYLMPNPAYPYIQGGMIKLSP